MTVAQLLTALFVLLMVGLALPVSYGVRIALFLALTVLGALTFIGGGMHYVIGLVR